RPGAVPLPGQEVLPGSAQPDHPDDRDHPHPFRCQVHEEPAPAGDVQGPEAAPERRASSGRGRAVAEDRELLGGALHLADDFGGESGDDVLRLRVVVPAPLVAQAATSRWASARICWISATRRARVSGSVALSAAASSSRRRAARRGKRCTATNSPQYWRKACRGVMVLCAAACSAARSRCSPNSGSRAGAICATALRRAAGVSAGMGISGALGGRCCSVITVLLDSARTGRGGARP